MAANKRKAPANSLTAAQRAAAAKTVAAPPQSLMCNWVREDAERQRSRDCLMARNAYWVYGAGF
jgi:hypothetical protein